MENRCSKLDELTKVILQRNDSNFIKDIETVKGMVLDLNASLLTTTKNEIEVNGIKFIN